MAERLPLAPPPSTGEMKMSSCSKDTVGTEIRTQPERVAASINLGWGDGTLMRQTRCKSEEMQRLEKFRHAICMLRVNGYLPTSQSNKMREKLMRAINAELKRAALVRTAPAETSGLITEQNKATSANAGEK